MIQRLRGPRVVFQYIPEYHRGAVLVVMNEEYTLLVCVILKIRGCCEEGYSFWIYQTNYGQRRVPHFKEDNAQLPTLCIKYEIINAKKMPRAHLSHCAVPQLKWWEEYPRGPDHPQRRNLIISWDNYEFTRNRNLSVSPIDGHKSWWLLIAKTEY